MLEKSRIAILGAGKMGETLISSLLGSGSVRKNQVVASAVHSERLNYIGEKYGVETSESNVEAVSNSSIILICVKPQIIQQVLEEIKEKVTSEQLVISIVASATTQYIEENLTHKVPVVRAMPNTPCFIRKGMTAICSGSYASEEHEKKAEYIFQQVGRTRRIDEKHFDAVTGLSASGPAFIYVVIESMAEGGVKTGLPRKIATELAAQAVLGAAAMVLETEDHPALLKDAVTTPAGCTIDGLMELEEGGLRVTFIKSIVKATERAAELISN